MIHFFTWKMYTYSKFFLKAHQACVRWVSKSKPETGKLKFPTRFSVKTKWVTYLIWDDQSRRIKNRQIVDGKFFRLCFQEKISSNDSCSIQVNFFNWKMYTFYLKQLNATEINPKSVNLQSDYKMDLTKKQSSKRHVKIYHSYLCKFWTFFYKYILIS